MTYSQVVKVQIIQTLSMLINNISNDTAVYFILSNNHINDLICHEFDPNDPDYMSYWIRCGDTLLIYPRSVSPHRESPRSFTEHCAFLSFVKGLSLKLNENSVQFFFNHAKQTFPLFTEAVRHFCHGESMVRIAVRTVTLKVFNIPDPGMRTFVLKHCTEVYFPALMAHLSEFSRNLNLSSTSSTFSSHGKLDQQTEELIDMFYYMADIYAIGFEPLNEALTQNLRDGLIRPLLDASLPGLHTLAENVMEAPRVSAHVVYFVLSQLIMAIRSGEVVESTAEILMKPIREANEASPESNEAQIVLEVLTGQPTDGGEAPAALVPRGRDANPHRAALLSHLGDKEEEFSLSALCLLYALVTSKEMSKRGLGEVDLLPRKHYNEVAQLRMLTEEPLSPGGLEKNGAAPEDEASTFEGDQLEVEAAPCAEVPESVVAGSSEGKENPGGCQGLDPYTEEVVDRLLMLLQRYPTCRLITLQVVSRLLQILVEPRERDAAKETKSCLLVPRHMVQAQRAYQLAIADLRNKQYGTMGDLFLDMFDDEVYALDLAERQFSHGSVLRLAASSFLLLPVVQQQVPGLELSHRLPCTDMDVTRKAIQMFLLTRRLLLELSGEEETLLPLKRSETDLRVEMSLDLTDEDVIACGVKTTAGQRPVSRYLVVDAAFMVLVEPDQTKIGWAIVRVVHPLMCVEAKMTKTADNRVLQVAIRTSKTQQEVMHLVFDDHIRCLAARQHLERGRMQVRARMMDQLNSMLWPEGRKEAQKELAR